MAHGRTLFGQTEAKARTSYYNRDELEDAEIAGQLALAHAALARHRAAAVAQPPVEQVIEQQIVEG